MFSEVISAVGWWLMTALILLPVVWILFLSKQTWMATSSGRKEAAVAAGIFSMIWFATQIRSFMQQVLTRVDFNSEVFLQFLQEAIQMFI